MKKIELKILQEYTGKELEPEKDNYWIFIQRNGQLYPISIPRPLSNDIPAWACYEIIDTTYSGD